MIQLSSSIEIPSKQYNAVWVQSIYVIASSPDRPIVATIKVCPYNSDTGDIAPTLSKVISVTDVTSESVITPSLGIAMTSIFTAVQDLINSGNVTF